MEVSNHTPNDANETPGGTTQTPGLPWHVAARSILPGLPRYKWQGTIKLHNERTVASGTEIAILQA